MTFCSASACRRELKTGTRFCPSCGTMQMVTGAGSSVLGAKGPGAAHTVGIGLAGASDVGLRHAINQDSFWISGPANGGPGTLAVLCDGVSSSQNAHMASTTCAMRCGETLLRGGTLSEAVATGFNAVCALPVDSSDTAPGPSTTVLALRCRSAAVGTMVDASWAWAGDSRLYWIPRQGVPQMLTPGHVDDLGRLVRCIGMGAEGTPELGSASFPRGDWLLLCTDGLWNYDQDMLVTASLLRKAASASEACSMMVAHALDCGGQDNVSMVVVTL